MGKTKDLTGQRFGSLVAIELANKPPMKNAIWKCRCDCGKYVNIYAQNLIKGKSKSCGCNRAKYVSDSKIKHGKRYTRIYGIWSGMKARCYSVSDCNYPNWGGRGIVMCDEWKDNFESFYNWAINNGYSDNLSIDRINNDGNYEPSNCRWVTQAEQNRNRRDNVYLTYNGETMTCAEWSRELGLYVGTVNNRLHKGYSVEECLFGRKETAHKMPKSIVNNHNPNDCCNLRVKSVCKCLMCLQSSLKHLIAHLIFILTIICKRNESKLLVL